jgi:hypothetical protein
MPECMTLPYGICFRQSVGVPSAGRTLGEYPDFRSPFQIFRGKRNDDVGEG